MSALFGSRELLNVKPVADAAWTPTSGLCSCFTSGTCDQITIHTSMSSQHALEACRLSDIGLGLFSAFMKVFNVLCYDIHTLLSWNNKTPALTSFFKNIFRHEQKKLMQLLKHQSCKKSFSWVRAVRCFFWFCSVVAVMACLLSLWFTHRDVFLEMEVIASLCVSW